MDDLAQKWTWDKSINTGNFWGALEASRADNDLSFFSNDTSPPPRRGDVNSMNNNLTTYSQWSGLSFQPYSLWGSPPPTPGSDTAMNRPQTQMSSVTASTSRSESPGEWNVSRNSSFGLGDPGWRDDTRHSNGSVMCTYDSLSVPSWSPGVTHSINQYESSWAPVPHPSATYDQRTNYQPFPVYEKKPVIDAGFALDKLAERFQDFKLKPQILSRRISDRKIRANMKKPACIECVFCKNNEESEKVYKSHVLKDVYGRIQCPILRLYRCPICGNPGGDTAHTIRYCPKSKAHHRKLETLASANSKREKRRAV